MPKKEKPVYPLEYLRYTDQVGSPLREGKLDWWIRTEFTTSPPHTPRPPRLDRGIYDEEIIRSTREIGGIWVKESAAYQQVNQEFMKAAREMAYPHGYSGTSRTVYGCLLTGALAYVQRILFFSEFWCRLSHDEKAFTIVARRFVFQTFRARHGTSGWLDRVDHDTMWGFISKLASWRDDYKAKAPCNNPCCTCPRCKAGLTSKNAVYVDKVDQ